MLTHSQTIPILDTPSFLGEKEEEVLFFDIETTGLSSDISSLYLIGILTVQNNLLTLTQWIADDYHSEEAILIAFFKYLENFTVLVHYNGARFDLPYLLKKCQKYSLPYSFDRIKSFDIYQKIRPFKTLFSLTGMKQKSIEQLLGLIRKDPYDGGELIPVYTQFLQHKILKKPFQKFLDPLLLHNQEDLTGLFACSFMLHYSYLISGHFTLTDYKLSSESLTITLENSAILPIIFEISLPFYSILFESKQTTLKIPLHSLELLYFFPNYKEYYYLPKEDTAIHKSAAAFVDQAFKEKAKASNCYIKKTSIFLPQFDAFQSPVFQSCYKSFPIYFEVCDETFSNPVFFASYAKHLLLHWNK